MKKFLRLTASLMAVFAMTSFIACSNDDDDDDDVAVTAVEITANATEVEAGKTITLKATVTPDNATDKTVTWTSSDEKIATVKDGTVTGVAEGKATITAKAGDKTATKEITVKAASSSDDSGSTGGSGSGDSGSTGGSGSGDSGETPSEGDSFANTYWILDGDFPIYESSDSEGTTVTGVIKDVQYIYLEDAASGKTYDIDYNAAEAAVQELVNAGTNGSRDIAYTKPDAFTYSVEGSEVTVTLKYLDEAGVEQTKTRKATISEDKTSISQKQTDDEGNEYTVVFKKATAAPQNAVLTVTVTKAEVYDLGALLADGFEAGAEKSVQSPATINEVLSIVGKAKFIADAEGTNGYVQAGQANSVTVPSKVLKESNGEIIGVNGGFYITVTLAKAGGISFEATASGGATGSSGGSTVEKARIVGLYTSEDVELLSDTIAADSSITSTTNKADGTLPPSTETPKVYTVSDLAAGTYKVFANGARIYSITVK